MDANTVPPGHSDANKESDQTDKAPSALRYATPLDLFEAIPQVGLLVNSRPRLEEPLDHYLERLKSGTTPEEAITVIGFAVVPRLALWWGYECLRLLPEALTDDDLLLMDQIAMWSTYPSDANRYQVMRTALYSPRRTAAVFLGLAVGWSGGQIAPNDAAPVPVWRCPRALNSAVLSCLAKAPLRNRSVMLARILDLGESLF